jgi:hypothetical protein
MAIRLIRPLPAVVVFLAPENRQQLRFSGATAVLRNAEIWYREGAMNL